ncbi:MAG: MBL fold metallo-hydrolase, partial [Fulvivirga sp.]|nr:MBL fold metallo-hydrolase [Fulvivirga sp.]
MNIKQIYDEALAHGSYVVASGGKVALVDPGRDPQPYIDFAKANDGEIVAVFETHPHADFTSSHIEFQQAFGAKIYVNPKVGVSYDFEPMEHNDEVQIGDVTFKALFTPGHSPDHNSYLLLDENGKEQAVFTGDSLFVGDVGRPDLREGTGNMQVSKKELAGMMYDTLQSVFSKLEDGVTVYPAHGPGSLCGKNMSPDLTSTIGKEKKENWAFQIKEKDKFIESFLEGQSFIPKYFPYDVELNRKGVSPLLSSLKNIPFFEGNVPTEGDGTIIIDIRDEAQFKSGHLPEAINIQLGSESSKFETWLGSIVAPEEQFYLVGENKKQLNAAIMRVAKIGYENQLKGAIYNLDREKLEQDETLDLDNFKNNPEKFTIVDIRNKTELADGKIFDHAINI